MSVGPIFYLISAHPPKSPYFSTISGPTLRTGWQLTDTPNDWQRYAQLLGLIAADSERQQRDGFDRMTRNRKRTSGLDS